MTEDYKSLGKRIQDRREECGLTQDELSDRAGLAYSTLAKIERGAVKNPSVFTIASIATALGTSVEKLLHVGKKTLITDTKQDTFLFCDLNGVLVRFFQKAFSQIANDNDLTVDKVETAFWHYNDSANRGEMSLEKFNKVMAERLSIKKFDWHTSYLENVEPIKQMHDFIREVIKTHRVGILTNIHQGLVPKMKKQGLIPDLDYTCIVDSSEVGAIKPERRMYEIAQEKAGASGSEILFVDDSRANLIAAQRLGWRVMWFDYYQPTDSIARLREALAA